MDDIRVGVVVDSGSMTIGTVGKDGAKACTRRTSINQVAMSVGIGSVCCRCLPVVVESNVVANFVPKAVVAECTALPRNTDSIS